MIHDRKVDFELVGRELPGLKDLFAGYNEDIVAAYLFGSLASGTVTPLSDIDIAVLFRKDLTPDIMESLENDLYFKLSKRFHTDEIDLIILNTAPLSIRYGVLRQKQLLFYQEKLKVVDFETETISDYLDFKPYREEMDREFLLGLANGN